MRGIVALQVLFKIDIPANRYDMLCLEGIARALNIFNRKLRGVDYRLADMAGACKSLSSKSRPQAMQVSIVDSSSIGSQRACDVTACAMLMLPGCQNAQSVLLKGAAET